MFMYKAYNILVYSIVILRILITLLFIVYKHFVHNSYNILQPNNVYLYELYC